MFALPAIVAVSVLVAPALPQPGDTGGKQPTAPGAAPSDAQQTITLRLIPTGAAKKLDPAPLLLPLSAKQPSSIKKLPDGLQSPRFGQLPLSGRKGATYHIALDEPEGKPPHLFVDANGDGDFTNDPAAEWARTREAEGDKPALYEGGAMFEPGGRAPRLHIIFSSSGQRQPEISYSRDYAAEGELTLAGKPYKVMLTDDSCRADFTSAGTRLLIDADGDGKFGGKGEAFDSRKPFEFGGATYGLTNIARDGTSFTVKRVDKTAPAARDPNSKEPANQAKVGKENGQRAFPFEDTTMDKKPVKFPGDYKGKVVLLDFWATWCPPCMAEVPNIAAVYKKLHADGFEILGVTLDNKNAEDKIRNVAKDKGMDWAQVYDGGGWQARLAKMYEIRSIPMAFLVDGDTGVILASGNALRGGGLETVIARELQKKKAH